MRCPEAHTSGGQHKGRAKWLQALLRDQDPEFTLMPSWESMTHISEPELLPREESRVPYHQPIRRQQVDYRGLLVVGASSATAPELWTSD